MEEKEVTYYLIWDAVVVKKDAEGVFLFRKGKWIADKGNVIMDHLYGYDPFEPEESPYVMFNRSIMEEIKEITEKQANEIVGEQLFIFLTDKWKHSFLKEKSAWMKEYCWPAKLVGISYRYAGNSYEVLPKDIGLTDMPYDQGLMECVMHYLEDDLREYGAEITFIGGLLD